MVRNTLLVAVVMLVGACQSNPKQTVLNLDTTDRKWASRECIKHRKAVADYNDGERMRGVLGFADYAVPFVGTAASLLHSWRQDPHRAELNRRVEAACVTPVRQQIVGKPYRGYANQNAGQRAGRYSNGRYVYGE